VRYTDTTTRTERNAHADWLVCTIPLSILSQIDMAVGPDMRAAIDAVPYETSVKIGLQFGRRFWEEDEQIYGGITHTDLPISTIGLSGNRLRIDRSCGAARRLHVGARQL
jgi:Monoamine oxidase